METPVDTPQIKTASGVYVTPATRAMDKLLAPDQCQLPSTMGVLTWAGGQILERLLGESQEKQHFVALSRTYLITYAQTNEQICSAESTETNAMSSIAHVVNNVQSQIDAMKKLGFIVTSEHNPQLIEIAAVKQLRPGQWIVHNEDFKDLQKQYI